VSLRKWNFEDIYAFRNSVFLSGFAVDVVEVFVGGDAILADGGGWMEAEAFLDYCVLVRGKQDFTF
jgi:hypothetical protein